MNKYKEKYVLIFIFFIVLMFSNCTKNDNTTPPPVNNKPPVADFVADRTTINVGNTVNFTSQCTESPTSYSWYFQKGTPQTTSIQNPTGVKYNIAGVYDVKLTATNNYGSDSKTKSGYITVILPNNPCPGLESFNYLGQIYYTVYIGTQCWMKSNLNVGKFIQSVNTGYCHTDVTDNGVVEKYCLSNDSVLCDSIGALYDWNEMMNYSRVAGIQGICPAGWHIPTDAEWFTMEHIIDPTVSNPTTTGWRGTKAGTELKYGGNSAFNAYLLGDREEEGNFLYQGNSTDFWTSTETDNSQAYERGISSTKTGIFRDVKDKQYGYALRCLHN